MENVGDVETSQALADAIERRRRELGMDSIIALANAAGVTVEGLRPLRRGEIRNYQERLTGPVCRALGWTPDSIDRLISGGEPVELRESATPPDVDLAAQVAQLQRDLDALADLVEQAVEVWSVERAALAAAMERLRQQESNG